MNKAELIERLSDKFDGNKAEAARALNAVTETITHTVATGEKVSVTGFGVFEKVNRPSRMVRNPRTGERKRAKATSVPRFRAGTDLKAYIAGDKKVPRAVKAAVKATVAKRDEAAAAPAKKSAAKKSAPAKKAATAKKATATKATAKKSAAKSTAAKSTAAKKSAAKKAPAKRTSTATKATSARKSTATKSTPAKKAPAKKASTAKKAPAKKASTAKKATPAKKSTAKKATTRRTARKS